MLLSEDLLELRLRLLMGFVDRGVGLVIGDHHAFESPDHPLHAGLWARRAPLIGASRAFGDYRPGRLTFRLLVNDPLTREPSFPVAVTVSVTRDFARSLRRRDLPSRAVTERVRCV